MDAELVWNELSREAGCYESRETRDSASHYRAAIGFGIDVSSTSWRSGSAAATHTTIRTAASAATAATPTPKQKPGPVRQGAQADDQPKEGAQDTIKLETELVLLDVTVIDQNNNPVYTLVKDDFSVFEDKVKQEIDNVSREEVPISMGLVIDTSGSMRSKLQTVTDAGLKLIRQMKGADEAFIAQFKLESELVLDYTRDQKELEEGLGELYTSGGTVPPRCNYCDSGLLEREG